jgi:hypothetical protein
MSPRPGRAPGARPPARWASWPALAACLAVVAACPSPQSPPTAGLTLQGRAPALGWRVQGPAQDLGGGTASLVQPGSGLAVAAGVSRSDGGFDIYVPPAVRPAKGSTWWLDVLRRRQGRLQGLRTVVQWDGGRWLSCSNGSDAVTGLEVTTATTAAAMVAQAAGLDLAVAIGTVAGTTVRLPEPAGAAWPEALQLALAGDLAAGRDPLRRSAAVISGRTPSPPRAGAPLTLTGFGFGASGRARLGGQDLTVRQWQDRQVTLQLPAGSTGGALDLLFADGRRLATEALLLDGGFQALESLRQPRGGEAVAVGALGATVVVAGGVDGQYVPLGTVERLTDGAAPVRAAALAKPRYGAAGAVLSSLFYVVGGTEAAAVSPAVEAYDPAQDSWQTVVALPQALTQPAVAATRTQLIVAGGDTGLGLSSRIYRWTPGTAAWQTATASLDPPRAGATAVALPDGGVVIAGGRDAQGRALSLVERYDPAADTLTPLPPLLVARYAHAMAVVGSSVVVAGGWQDATGALASLETLGTGAAAWLPGPSLPSPRYGLAAAAVGDAVWFVGGANESEGSGGEVWRWRP